MSQVMCSEELIVNLKPSKSSTEGCLENGRRSRERRPPVSEIVTDTPAICQRDTGQRSRSAMVTPRHEGTPYLIEVTPRPGKYE